MSAQQQSGFTLVELAIVLIIIGVIVGSVTKGRDLIRSAENKKIYSTFINEWRIAYMTFNERTGRILGDKDNNGRADSANGTSTLINSAATDQYLGLADVGINPPTAQAGVNPWEYRYADSRGVTRLMNIGFGYQGGGAGYNYLRVRNMTDELARSIDVNVDGQADGTTGFFIRNNGSADWSVNPASGSLPTNNSRWIMDF